MSINYVNKGKRKICGKAISISHKLSKLFFHLYFNTMDWIPAELLTSQSLYIFTFLSVCLLNTTDSEKQYFLLYVFIAIYKHVCFMYAFIKYVIVIGIIVKYLPTKTIKQKWQLQKYFKKTTTEKSLHFKCHSFSYSFIFHSQLLKAKWSMWLKQFIDYFSSLILFYLQLIKYLLHQLREIKNQMPFHISTHFKLSINAFILIPF